MLIKKKKFIPSKDEKKNIIIKYKSNPTKKNNENKEKYKHPKMKINIFNMKFNEAIMNEKTSSLFLMNIIKANMNQKKEEVIENNIYNDYEINSLIYNEALKIDKRTYIEYYCSLLRRKQILLFTFFINNDYNSKSIKICLFLFSFALYYTINTIFFNDATMHKIYIDKGKYNLIYQIPNILYSSLISTIISILIKYLSITEKNIIEIKNNKNEIKKSLNIKKCLNIKIFLFFILNFLFLILFWYYISCFCAIYKNTQIHLIKDTLISFGLSLLYPVGLCLLPGILRIPSLRAFKQNEECTYKLSQFIQNII